MRGVFGCVGCPQTSRCICIPHAMTTGAPSLVDEELLALRLGNLAEAGFAPRVGKSKDLPEFESQVRTISLRERWINRSFPRFLPIRVR